MTFFLSEQHLSVTRLGVFIIKFIKFIIKRSCQLMVNNDLEPGEMLRHLQTAPCQS